MLRPQKGNSGVSFNDTLLNFGLWSVKVNSCTVQLYTRPENLCTVHGNPAKMCGCVYQFLNIFLKLNRKKLFETFLWNKTYA